ncbi:MAG: hypothetical protein NWE86_00720 [Candidatus Bathyarchaeota archaeon]|nr:hypothetical protein [Candidatus Bathyarchaeota archaeon]
MEISIYNSLKSRLETIDIEFTEKNTTWFDCENDNDIYMITDFNDGILIKELGYSYPIWIDGETRASIAYDQQKAKKLKCMIC